VHEPEGTDRLVASDTSATGGPSAAHPAGNPRFTCICPITSGPPGTPPVAPSAPQPHRRLPPDVREQGVPRGSHDNATLILSASPRGFVRKRGLSRRRRRRRGLGGGDALRGRSCRAVPGAGPCSTGGSHHLGSKTDAWRCWLRLLPSARLQQELGRGPAELVPVGWHEERRHRRGGGKSCRRRRRWRSFGTRIRRAPSILCRTAQRHRSFAQKTGGQSGAAAGVSAMAPRPSSFPARQ